MAPVERYGWMQLGYGQPGFADTQPITAYTVTGSGCRSHPRPPREDKLSYRARCARVCNRVRMALMAPRENRRYHEQDEGQDTEHGSTSFPGYYPWLGHAHQMDEAWRATAPQRRLTIALTMPFRKDVA